MRARILLAARDVALVGGEDWKGTAERVRAALETHDEITAQVRAGVGGR